MAEMRFKVFRLSINWGRIFTTSEDPLPNEEGVYILTAHQIW